MEARIDFVQQLQVDMAVKILECLDDPKDLIRASVVSPFWNSFVISNQISKKLCIRLFPQLSNCVTKKYADSECSNVVEWETLERDYMSFAFLAHNFTSFASSECLEEAISASSTDNFLLESVRNTLYPQDRILHRPCYWSSKGNKNPEVPETLIYKLLANVCFITEIDIHPYEADFQYGDPIYSAKSVRFKTGHPKSSCDVDLPLTGLPLQLPADDKFIWTYTSPEFPMEQKNCLQKFVLPEPVLCIGGYIQIELLGRVQTQEADDLYYICVSHVKVLGKPLYPKFDAEILEPTGKFLLKYFPENKDLPPPKSLYSQLGDSLDNLPDHLRNLEHLFNDMDGNALHFDFEEWDNGDFGDDNEDDDDVGYVMM